ncbi:hypothetical protein CYMTET_56935 [Cymbomonas tetramitiformis]|uniref:Uncharacterized protein n=1 Tax=Cymbomonas tetramitiformis TaxID=36881 RepID=A0AAE0BBP7_9CHLO|nr:hypothetical protein CYMTET_56935 [Cymbomonas tetramitiformis]
MAVNPALTSAGQGRSFPRAFENEAFLLHREGLEMEVDIPSGSRKQSHRGILYVSNIRMVFVANQPTDDFRAFDIPLVYLRKERFNQPIFGCNNLTGDVFSVAGGGPNSSTPPYSVRIFFKEGGCGTFLPLFFNLLEQVRGQMQQSTAHEPSAPSANIPVAQPVVQELVRTAYVDPSDPSTLYVSQPQAMESVQPVEHYPTYSNKRD